MERQSNMSDIKINLDSLSQYLRKRYPDRQIVFDGFPSLLDFLIYDLRIRRIETIGDLHKILERTQKAVELFEKNHPPYPERQDIPYSAQGIVRISLKLLDDDFFAKISTMIFDGMPEGLKEYRKYILPEE